MLCSKTPDSFILFNNVILHVLILFMIISCLFIFIITKLTNDHINELFIHMIDTFVNPDKLKEIFLNKNTNLLKPQLIQILKIDTADPAQVIILDKIIVFINDSKKPDINHFLTTLINDYSSNKHPLRTQINDSVYIEIYIIIAFFIIFAVLVNTLNMGNYCGVLKKLSIELLIIFSFVGIIEYWFFNNVASKYVPVKPDVIISTFKNTIRNMF